MNSTLVDAVERCACEVVASERFREGECLFARLARGLGLFVGEPVRVGRRTPTGHARGADARVPRRRTRRARGRSRHSGPRRPLPAVLPSMRAIASEARPRGRRASRDPRPRRDPRRDARPRPARGSATHRRRGSARARTARVLRGRAISRARQRRRPTRPRRTHSPCRAASCSAPLPTQPSAAWRLRRLSSSRRSAENTGVRERALVGETEMVGEQVGELAAAARRRPTRSRRRRRRAHVRGRGARASRTPHRV